MQLFYSSNISGENDIFTFSKEESRHIVKVLRKKLGESINMTNGKGWLFTGKLIEINPKRCSIKIKNKSFHKPRGFKLHLAVAPTKMNDRYEWFLEKATEIGVETITPVICDNSERKVVKSERFEKIIQSAMKQSLQYYLPELKNAISFRDFITQIDTKQKYIAHCNHTDRKTLKTCLNPNEDCIILIGPEGDFSVKEIQQALQNNFIPVTLGETRLRTETAGIVACHSVALINES
ncbi:16S rRNA (uracil(1498)-N(3))-methyltransferase [Winogradskyella alexanderae]|uniref:Ribosomal RNA small subunit methyltransferase E n=1 Tax=Winogradskyella alexanderae TaxID=2877123 RepID=A0ABS7XUX2_9FLAO|nr:16S rRNA (uracil(1498)-N(3))-methyltransferase [Winogradskyella alexanderae]MCA0132626.1 16S rRNA (uracil(1498)-N(3))-methyltransferase [Winogradskyella alexanderae]